MTRPLCQEPAACRAKTPGKHCRSCDVRARNADPEFQARRKAAIRAKHADPEFRALHAKRAAARLQEVRERRGPEWLKEHGRKLHAISMTDAVRDKLRASAADRRRKRSDTVLAWCPHPYRSAYEALVRSKRKTAAEAREIIERQIAEDRLRQFDHALAADFLRRLASVYRCDASGAIDPVGTHWRYGTRVIERLEVVRIALTKGWKPERLAA